MLPDTLASAIRDLHRIKQRLFSDVPSDMFLKSVKATVDQPKKFLDSEHQVINPGIKPLRVVPVRGFLSKI